jgi:DDE superfamily endonuclease
MTWEVVPAWPPLPPWFASVLNVFTSLCSPRVWLPAQLLLLGARLGSWPTDRDEWSTHRRMGRRVPFVHSHRLLNRARWSGRAASRRLLGLLVTRFAPVGPMVLGWDDTIGRRRGKRIPAKGIERDPVRRSHSHFVKASGLRSRQFDVVGSGAVGRLAPGLYRFSRAWLPGSARRRNKGSGRSRYWTGRGKWSFRPSIGCRDLVIVGESAFSALERGQALIRQNTTVVSRWPLEAALYEPAPFRPPGTNGRPRQKGKRLATRRHVLHQQSTAWQR